MPKYYQGKFTPTQPQKYVGDINDIVYRSSWERRFMVFCDNNPNVMQWNSESVIIPYYSPVDKKNHRYFPDFLIRMKNKEGEIKDVLIEVKPLKQCAPPNPKSKQKHPRRFLKECKTWEVNKAKWAAAREFCAKNQMEFMLITEKQLGRGT